MQFEEKFGSLLYQADPSVTLEHVISHANLRTDVFEVGSQHYLDCIFFDQPSYHFPFPCETLPQVLMVSVMHDFASHFFGLNNEH